MCVFLGEQSIALSNIKVRECTSVVSIFGLPYFIGLISGTIQIIH